MTDAGRCPSRAALRSLPAQTKRQALVAEACAHGNALAADGAAATQYGCAALGLHARAETMRLNALAAIGLKCALGHKNALLFLKENLRLDGKF
jgi:hypothetical protein